MARVRSEDTGSFIYVEETLAEIDILIRCYLNIVRNYRCLLNK